MIKNMMGGCFLAMAFMLSAPAAQAIPVDLELILATDTSGSVDGTDFTLRRSGVEAAFRSAAVISAIENGAIGSIAVALWDFGTGVGQINGAMGQLNKATQQNASASEELAATAEDMGGQSTRLAELMSFFRLDNGAELRAGVEKTAAARRVQVRPAIICADAQDCARF